MTSRSEHPRIITARIDKTAYFSYTLRRACAMAVIFSFTASVLPAMSANIKDLGPLDGDSISVGLGVNASGQVVGYSLAPANLDFRDRAVLYSNGRIIPIATLGGSRNSANAINASGQVVGYSFTTASQLHAFLYSGDRVIDLDTLGSSYGSYARAINDSGQVVGYWRDAPSGFGGNNAHAFLYSGGRMIDLLPANPASDATGINASGQIVGSAYITGKAGQHAFLFSGGSLKDLNTLGGLGSSATGVNASGQVVGSRTQLPLRPTCSMHFCTQGDL